MGYFRKCSGLLYKMNEEVINAAKIIKDYCLKSSCLTCPCWNHLCDEWGCLDEIADEIIARLE